MTVNHVITDNELQPFMGKDNPEPYPHKLSAFIKQQCFSWPELSTARQFLNESAVKTLFLSDFYVRAQYNRHRIKSSSARVDRESVKRRPCFLCPANLYPQQKYLPYKEDWVILNNPFPIFIDHLVVSHHKHYPQLIDNALGIMIAFVKDMNFSFTAFYNGPACGASAPDHLHFQACPAGGIPITLQLANLINPPAPKSPLSIVDENKNGKCYTGAVDKRAFFLCFTKNPAFLFDRLKRALNFLKDTTEVSPEPMINIIISGIENNFMAILCPRKAHRPACYYKHGNDMILVSPGAVDVGGVVILPRKADYEKVKKEDLLEIFSEVCHAPDIFQNLSF